MRKRYSAEFKSRVVLELMREDGSLSELASEYEVHPSMLHRWREAALADLPKLFSEPSKRNTIKLTTHAHGVLGPTGGLRPEAMLLTLHPELGHLAFNDTGIGTQPPRGEDMPGIEHISERLAAQGL